MTHKELPKNCLFYGLAEEMTDEQREFVNSIYGDDYDIIFCNAPAGTGKTTLAVAAAKMLVDEHRKDGLVYIFAPVEENKMGFRPGDQSEKEKEYSMALRNALDKIGDKPDKVMRSPYDAATKPEAKVWVEIMSHTFARGINIENKVVIIDEAQNFTALQLKKILTRCHDSCKVVVIGHTGQIDLPMEELSGFKRYIEHFSDKSRTKICTLTKNFRGWIANCADSLKC